jgi:hypothetical protein
MKRILVTALLLVVVLLPVGCSRDQVTAPDPGPVVVTTDARVEAAALAIMAQTGWEFAEDQEDALPLDKTGGAVVFVSRDEVAPGIAHYFWTVQMGAAPEDKIGLHRVVKEARHNRPIRTRQAIFLQHGDAKDFTGMFLPGTLSATTPDDFGAAVYWAEADVDVWGIDQAWTLVPAETADFAFMADWGMDKQSADLGVAVAIARMARLYTGNGYDKMILSGYSSGSATGYALLNAETQLPPGRRQVGGWIPVDYSPVSDNDDWNQYSNCDYIPGYQDMMAAGEYGYFVGFDYMGVLARDDPDGPSPVFEGFTNLQAAMYLGAGPIFGVDDIHYLGGVWEDGLPVDFRSVTVEQWLDFMVAGAPWEPVRFMLDYCIWSCPGETPPWDDHFAEIEVPILNVAAAGGIGEITQYCLGLVGSDDITDLTIQLLPDDQVLYDFGHIDLWIADEAPTLVWQPILAWIGEHSHNDHRSRERQRH